MDRRRVVFGLALSPFIAGQAQAALPVIGFLSSRAAREAQPETAAFKEGLRLGGFPEGSGATVHYRWADGRFDRLPALAEDLVREKAQVVVAAGGNVAASAIMKIAPAMPVVFTGVDQPIETGLVRDLSRPGGQATGFMLFTYELEAKKLEILTELVPGLKAVGLLSNPAAAMTAREIVLLRQSCQRLGLTMTIAEARNADELPAALATIAASGVQAVLVSHDPLFVTLREPVITWAAKTRLPAIYTFRQVARDGGLITYGNNLLDNYRGTGVYVSRILKGTAPGDLPVVQPTKFELAINLRTAEALGLDVPPALLIRADELID